MPAPGFPNQNPRNNRPNTVRPAVSGGLLDWLRWNFPGVYAEVTNVKRDTRVDYKSQDYASQFPTRSGRTP